MTGKKWIAMFSGILGCLLLIVLIGTVIVDPYFHFHAPFENISYRLYEERYINDGIARNFDYDAIIIGTSMTENFKTSEMDALFGTHSVKLPYSGALFAEISTALDRALSRNPQVKTVLWCVDYSGLIRNYDATSYDNIPEYLYDDEILNDVSYVFNKDILYRGTMQNVIRTLKGQENDTFDEYASWEHETGLEHILLSYEPAKEIKPESVALTPETAEMVRENIQKNICDVVEKYPDTTFYLYYPPYSIIYWDELYRNGDILPQIEAEEITSQMLLEKPNVKLFCFFENAELVTDLILYNDKFHSRAEINSEILLNIWYGNHELTRNNLEEHIKNEKVFFTTYDYEGIFE